MAEIVDLQGRPLTEERARRANILLAGLRVVEQQSRAEAEHGRVRSFAAQLEELARTNGVAATREMCERVLARLERDGWK